MSALCPRIPREQWQAHPHFPDQVLLLGSHANFRRISAHLVEAAEAGAALGPIASLYWRWIAAMRSHEAYEEIKLYPYLEHRWRLSLAPAEAGHRRLHACHDEVIVQLRGVGTGTGASLALALRAHDAALTEHLELEEDLVIPGLLALEPEEFRRYSSASIETLLGARPGRPGRAQNISDPLPSSDS